MDAAKRQTPRENLDRARQKRPSKNQISTSERVITGKGESKDEHSPFTYVETGNSSFSLQRCG